MDDLQKKYLSLWEDHMRIHAAWESVLRASGFINDSNADIIRREVFREIIRRMKLITKE